MPKPKPRVTRPRRRKADPERVASILDRLAELYPDADCELAWKNPYQLLAATILSAQCTDVRVNMVTPELFRRWPTPEALSRADATEVENVIKSTGFFRNKAKSLVGMSRGLTERHGGQVPRAMEEMLELPGVARKTANVVLGTAYGLATGVVVDTHIARLSNRLGLTKSEDPKVIEQDLMEQIPQDQWIVFGHRLIWHGRRICVARSPRCGECALAPRCPSADLPAAKPARGAAATREPRGKRSTPRRKAP